MDRHHGDERDEEDDQGEHRERKMGGAKEKGGKPSMGEVMSSAKIVAGAAKGEKYDKAEVCKAASTVLSAASAYGGLDEKEGMGSYIGKAEGLLRKYGGGGTEAEGGGHKTSHSSASESEESPKGKKKHTKKDDGEEEGGHGKFGGYLKMAQGFMKD
ncbi:hypothetical protein ACFX2C_011314 [Malus domestica]